IAYYHVYRSTAAGVLGSVISTVLANASQDTYHAIDSFAGEGSNRYYRVTAIDSSGHESDPSSPVAVRPRLSTIPVPGGVTVGFGIDVKGTTSSDGLPGTDRWACNVDSEDDDVVGMTIGWNALVGYTPLEYHIYRRAADEATYMRVAVVKRGNPPPAT